LYAFFWVLPRRLNFICRRFGTLCQTPGNYPEESIQHLEHSESLKSRNLRTSFLIVNDQVLDPHNSADKIIVQLILLFTLLENGKTNSLDGMVAGIS
jgi:hypothetical protein